MAHMGQARIQEIRSILKLQNNSKKLEQFWNLWARHWHIFWKVNQFWNCGPILKLWVDS